MRRQLPLLRIGYSCGIAPSLRSTLGRALPSPPLLRQSRPQRPTFVPIAASSKSFSSSTTQHFENRTSNNDNTNTNMSSPADTSTSKPTTTTTTTPPSVDPTKDQTLLTFCSTLAKKQPTPGGGAAAAVAAAVGAATAEMAAAYTQRKKDQESGAAERARQLQKTLDFTRLLQMADDDAQAYLALQATWSKDCALTVDELNQVHKRALEVPTVLLETCHKNILAIQEFLPHCNPNIPSDAKVGVHVLAGAARAAYQTVLVNQPSEEEKKRLVELLMEIQAVEMEMLGL